MTGSTSVAYYNGGNVGIGTATPGAKLHVNGDIIADGAFIVSDRNLKTNIVALTGALNKILSLSGYTFRWKASQRSDV